MESNMGVGSTENGSVKKQFMVWRVQTREIWKYNINILFLRQNESKENVGLVFEEVCLEF
jgi:hypothetical protein